MRALALVVLLGACGAGGPRVSRDLRDELGSAEVREARERAPELILEAESALDAADEAEGRGDLAAAEDRATEARLYLEAARNEAARAEDEAARRALEVETGRVLAQARRDEEAREEVSRELARRAAARTADEEASAALEQAIVEEGTGSRRRRVGLDDAAAMRRGAAAIRERARLALASAEALGASADALERTQTSLRESESSQDPVRALELADRAYASATAALGAARGASETTGADRARALMEMAEREGLDAFATPLGVVVEASGVLGAGASLPRGAAPRIERLARLLTAFPRGPVQVQVSVSGSGASSEAAAMRRAEAARAALARGADGERLHASLVGAALRAEVPADRVRLVFDAYVP
ncbi:MAG: hypothetical protein AB7S26_05040 [Sandaracinaceae bacterium]